MATQVGKKGQAAQIGNVILFRLLVPKKLRRQLEEFGLDRVVRDPETVPERSTGGNKVVGPVDAVSVKSSYEFLRQAGYCLVNAHIEQDKGDDRKNLLILVMKREGEEHSFAGSTVLQAFLNANWMHFYVFENPFQEGGNAVDTINAASWNGKDRAAHSLVHNGTTWTLKPLPVT